MGTHRQVSVCLAHYLNRIVQYARVFFRSFNPIQHIRALCDIHSLDVYWIHQKYRVLFFLCLNSLLLCTLTTMYPLFFKSHFVRIRWKAIFLQPTAPSIPIYSELISFKISTPSFFEPRNLFHIKSFPTKKKKKKNTPVQIIASNIRNEISGPKKRKRKPWNTNFDRNRLPYKIIDDALVQLYQKKKNHLKSNLSQKLDVYVQNSDQIVSIDIESNQKKRYKKRAFFFSPKIWRTVFYH